jgi:AcrR family transcriptional regulator
MTDDVKPRRRSTLRAERAAVTRRRIADAARLLFVRDGYGATTLQAIAVEADVAVQTVYAVYGSKAGIVRELRDSVVFQPEADALVRVALDVPGAGDRLALFARSIRVRWTAGSDVVIVYREAASTDPVLQEEHAAVYERRRGGLAGLAASLDGSLGPGIDVGRAAAILNALTLPEVYQELSGAHGWTPDEFETWLAASLRRLLLDDAG